MAKKLYITKTVVFLLKVLYKTTRPFLFRFDSETIHEIMVNLGFHLGKTPVKNIFSMLPIKEKSLMQNYFGINFINPIGLSAGFDYNANLTEFLPYLGFGFETVGTVTNNPYSGNPQPRLGRLVKSKSLMVNKGFKNDGIDLISKKITGKNFLFPLGVSIGATNSPNIKNIEDAISDTVTGFKKMESKKLNHSYYELNISCPNLIHSFSFYDPKKLNKLLEHLDSLNIQKPVFVKMPIILENHEVDSLLKVIVGHKIKGVIFGNLLKDRKHKLLNQEEVRKFIKGGFSGKPTFERSNELIAHCYRQYGNRLLIIGCGGVFSAEDAYTKIKLGASLIQLITGIVFNGPQLPSEINLGLIKLLKKDGYKNINEAIGKFSIN